VTTIRVGAFNFYEANRRKLSDATLLRSLNLDLAGGCEASKVHKLLRNVTGLQGVGGFLPGHGARENIGLVRKTWNITGVCLEQVTEDLDTRIAHDRWLLTILATTPEGHRIAGLFTHFNAAIVDKDGNVRHGERIEEHRQHTELLLEAVKAVRHFDYAPIICADGNVPPGSDYDMAPDKVLPAAGFNLVQHRLDFIAYDVKEFALVGHKLIQPHGADHKWITANLKVRT
jgi:hypothetical protein